MKSERFYNDLASFVRENDVNSANSIIMNEIGTILVGDRDDFITLLNASGVFAEQSNSDPELIQKFINNLPSNEKLRIGTAYLVAHKNKTLSFNGEEEVNDAGVKAMNKVIRSYFDSRNFPDSADNYYSEAGGATVSAVSQGIGEISKFGKKIAEGQQKKKYGGIDMAAKQADAKNKIIQAALKQRLAQQAAAQKKADQAAKTRRIVIISTAAVIGIAAIVGTIIYFKNKK